MLPTRTYSIAFRRCNSQKKVLPKCHLQNVSTTRPLCQALYVVETECLESDASSVRDEMLRCLRCYLRSLFVHKHSNTRLSHECTVRGISEAVVLSRYLRKMVCFTRRFSYIKREKNKVMPFTAALWFTGIYDAHYWFMQCFNSKFSGWRHLTSVNKTELSPCKLKVKK